MTAVLLTEGPLQVSQPAAPPLNPLWLEVFAQLAYHIRGEDVTALDALNRRASLVMANELGQMRVLIPSGTTIEERWLGHDELRAVRRFHRRRSPARRELEPLILLRWEGQLWALDGSKRVNLWRQQPGPARRAIVLEQRRRGLF